MAIIFRVFMIVFLFGHVQFAQASQERTLVDSLSGLFSCSDLRYRLDKFFEDIIHDDGTVGYVVLHGAPDYRLSRYFRLTDIQGQRDTRNFPADRMIVLYGPESDDLKIDFWKVPSNAEVLPFPKAHWNANKLITEPKLIFSTGGSGSECYGDHQDTFMNLLVNNPELKGRIIIKGKNQAVFGRTKAELLAKFQRVPSRRLEFVFEKAPSLDYQLRVLPETER